MARQGSGHAADIAQALAGARQFLSAGQTDAAARLVEDVLALSPRHEAALELSAMVLAARGDMKGAFELFSILATQFPDRAGLAVNLAELHRVEGRHKDACFCLERAVQLEPETPAYRATLASLLIDMGEPEEARRHIAVLRDLCRRQPVPDMIAEGHSLSARIALGAGDLPAAEAELCAALALRPDAAPDLAALSDLLARLHRRKDALDVARRLYLTSPTSHAHALALASRLVDLELWDEAERHVERIVASAPHHAEAHALLAACRIGRGQGAEALVHFSRWVRQAPDNVEMLLRMALLVRLNGEPEKALSFAEIALRKAPHALRARSMRDELLLILGRLDAVWPSPPAPPPVPAAVTVPVDMPATDIVLFARFAGRLAPAGERIVCHAEPDLLPLLAGMVGLAPTCSPAGPDAMALSDVPARFGSAASGVPSTPYLAVETGFSRKWARALEGLPRPLVGLAWNDTAPGPSLAALLRMLENQPAGIGTWISLAFDDARRHLASHPHIVDAGAHFADSRDLIAAVSHLDFTIGADSLPLHVAGAVGREGIVLVPPHTPWTWAWDAGRSLWYPTIRVIRQPKHGEWNEAGAELADALRTRFSASPSANG